MFCKYRHNGYTQHGNFITFDFKNAIKAFQAQAWLLRS